MSASALSVFVTRKARGTPRHGAAVDCGELRSCGASGFYRLCLFKSFTGEMLPGLPQPFIATRDKRPWPAVVQSRSAHNPQKFYMTSRATTSALAGTVQLLTLPPLIPAALPMPPSCVSSLPWQKITCQSLVASMSKISCGVARTCTFQTRRIFSRHVEKESVAAFLGDNAWAVM